MGLAERSNRLLGDPVAARHVYGEAYRTPDGTTIIPVSRVSGFIRGAVRPVGVFVVRGDSVTWLPALDHTGIALLGECVGLVAAVIAALAVLRRPPWPDLSRR